jgi:hypothetical protein
MSVKPSCPPPGSGITTHRDSRRSRAVRTVQWTPRHPGGACPPPNRRVQRSSSEAPPLDRSARLRCGAPRHDLHPYRPTASSGCAFDGVVEAEWSPGTAPSGQFLSRSSRVIDLELGVSDTVVSVVVVAPAPAVAGRPCALFFFAASSEVGVVEQSHECRRGGRRKSVRVSAGRERMAF